MKRLFSALLSSGLLVCLLALLAAPACQQQSPPSPALLISEARAGMYPHLAQLGARNWIVVADPTCPVLAGPGIETINVPTDSVATFREVLDLLELQGSLTPRIWVCNELEAVSEKRAPGIGEYRRQLQTLLDGRFHYYADSRIIDLQLAQAASTYRILYIKTESRLPYSSVAIELDSGYWNPDAESEVRERMQKLAPPVHPAETPLSPIPPVLHSSPTA